MRAAIVEAVVRIVGGVGAILALSVARPAFAEAPRPNLWVLSAGVSRYADTNLNLNFAAGDARAVAEALQGQGGRRVYGEVHSRLLLDQQVTRESILTGIREFIARAEADDVAVIFFAGHGVRDLLTGTYYFLPHNATAEEFFTRGLRVEEFNDLVRILQRHVRHVVVMLDTCHAGALSLSTAQMTLADDFARQVRSEGVFVLAATRPGDKAKEVPRLGHGVFTHALLRALGGEANAGIDGLLSLAELVIYLGVEVPRLTQAAQTPYYLIAGTDLVFADVRQPNSIAVLEFVNQGPRDATLDWMGRSLREGFYFALGAVPVLHRCPLPADEGNGRPTAATAQALGCGKFITGSYAVAGDQVDIRARVVDTATNADEVTATVRGRRENFAELKDRLVRDIVTRMPEVRGYLLMLESQGGDPDALPLTAPTPEPHSRAPQQSSPAPAEGRNTPALFAHLTGWLDGLGPAAAWAQPAAVSDDALDVAVRRLLDQYRMAHEQKNIEKLAGLWVNFSPRQREAMRRYFDQAGNLTLELVDVAIEPHEGEVTVAATRIERFVDRESGKPVRLQIAQRIILSRTGTEVKIIRIESQ